MSKPVVINWGVHVELSVAHAAHVVATGAPCIDSKCEQLLIDPVTQINTRLLSASMDVAFFWQHLVREIFRERAWDDACRTALTEAGCSEFQLDQLAKSIARQLSDARHAFLTRFPKLAEQLPLRAQPLQQQWSARGQGILRTIANQVNRRGRPIDLWPKQIEADWVQPIRGGDGGYDVSVGRVWMEAMLTDVDDRVPEILRLVWLMTSLAIECRLLRQSETKGSHDLSALTAIPLVLAAGRELELIRTDVLPIEQAMRLWQIGDTQQAAIVMQWWADFQADDIDFDVAIENLADRLMHR